MTRLLHPLLPLLAGILLTAGAARAEPSYETLNRALTDQVVIPAYQQMAAAMADLDAASGEFCAAPDAAALAGAKDAFGRAMDAWQRAQPIALGPVTWDGRAARIEFWPDKSGTAARQLRQALQDQDPALVAAGGLEGKSVALQNLATYERLLYERGDRIAAGGAGDEDRYACALMAAIARFQAGLSAEILADWTAPDGYREAVLSAAAGNEHYAAADEPALELLKSISGALDLAIQVKLERPLGKFIDQARPKRAESWRSGRSLDDIAANLETVRQLYAVPGGFGDLLAAAGAGPLDIGLRKQFVQAVETARSIGLPLSQAVTDAAGRAQVDNLVEQLKRLRLLIAGSVADEIGLVIGFNALDGD
jgi:predicted lipoprotein